MSRHSEPGGTANVVPVVLEIAGDLLTPVSAYLRLTTGGETAFLLESTEAGSGSGDHSFLGVGAVERLVVQRGVLTIRTAAGSTISTGDGDPLRALDARLQRHRSRPDPALPPFTGGAVGYIGYDAVRHLENVPVPAGGADVPDAVLMIFRTIIAFDHRLRRVLLIGNVMTDEEPLETGRERVMAELRALRDGLARPVAAETAIARTSRLHEPADLPLTPALGEARYTAAVRRIKRHIRDGDILQCVLSDQFTMPLGGVPPFTIYRHLRTISPSPYLFHLAMDDSPGHALLGASPEMLTRVRDGVIETRPIAGSRPRGGDAAEDERLRRAMLRSVKERAEHVMLVDLGRNDVGRVSRPGSVTVDGFMRVENFSHIMHLVSSVLGRLRPDVSAMEGLLSCFPAGTLSGAPKIRAMEIIAGLEGAGRGPYGGAVICRGFSGTLDSCITIRSLHVLNGIAHLQAGAGIVADSNPAWEYAEVLQKARAVRAAVAAACAPASGEAVA
jgi:anthranilate synthase component 1